jgi:hypothetical protein
VAAGGLLIRDSLAERHGFEPPVPRGLIWAEFGPSVAHYSVRIKAFVLERICSLRIRLCFGSLRFSSFARPMGGMGVTPNIRRSSSGSTSPSLGAQSATQPMSLRNCTRRVSAGGGAGAVCGPVSLATKNEQMMTEGEDL